MIKSCVNLAAVDIGTNSFHLIVAKADCDGNFEIIDREKEVVRLGEGHIGDIKRLSEESIERSIITLKRFKGIADSHKAAIRAVATSAVRESFNNDDFVARVLSETGIEVEVVSGFEEARLIYQGIMKAVPVFNLRSLTIDIGGGSTEFIFGKEGSIDYSISLKLGAVRLTRKFFPDYNVTRKKIKECRNWVEGEIFHVSRKSLEYKPEICVGSSGTILTTAFLASLKRGGAAENTILNNFEMSYDEVLAVEELILKKKSPDDRKRISGLDDKRAEIIPAGIIILSSVMRLFEIDKIVSSDYALREGILIDTIQNTLNLTGINPRSDIRKESVRKLALSCNYARDHCDHVSTLALLIYDQLTGVHNLEKNCREYLEAAAKLHDIGYHISHSQHHIHSHYIIKNSELLGFNQNEIDVIANVARYHRKSHPKKRHKYFFDLPEKNKDIVNKLSAILRIADSLDRTHTKNISSVSIEYDERNLIIEIGYRGELPEIELWNLNRRKALFEEVYGRIISIKTKTITPN